MNSFFARRYVVTAIFLAVALILLGRLYYLQIVDNRYILIAKNNVVRTRIVFPARGPILDRNHKVLVENQPVYDIMVTPKNVKPFDTLEFCHLLGIDMEGFRKRFQKAKVTGGLTRASVFEGQLSAELFASLQERLYEFPGFDVQLRSVRSYPDSIAAHFLGYTNEVQTADIENPKWQGYYHQGDYIGRSGVERSYETDLRGQRGVQNLMVDSRGIPKGKFANGAYDTAAVAGERLISSLDSRIQKLGEQLMHNKVGSIVAIEPSTGEILAFVSSPGYNPNLMIGRDAGNNYIKLLHDPNKPSLVRPIQALYPPGSSFKPLSALIGIQEGVITPQTAYVCNGYYTSGNRRIPCFHGERHGVVTLSSAVAHSCNGYFDMVFEKMINKAGARQTEPSFNDWRSKVIKFGLGAKLGVDLPGEYGGLVASAKLYNKWYPKDKGGWRSSTIISLGIGQGEISATPLQLANIEATIANKGFYYTPHLIKGIGAREVVKKEFTVKNYVGIDSAYFDPVIDGMQEVVDRGTAVDSKIPGIIMCGKTGTAQTTAGEDNSVFVAFAPRENPKIAIAVVVEHGGQGARWAAPIASFMIEKYLRDSIAPRPNGARPEWFMNQSLIKNPSPPIKVKKDSVKKMISDTGNSPSLPKLPVKNNKRQTVAMLPKRKESYEQ